MHLESVEPETYKLDELAEKAGASPRTVRYYVQRGLLPAPEFRGKDTAYTREHLVRLRAIKKLQERFLPLDAIQTELASRSLEDIERITEGGAAVSLRPEPSMVHPYRSPPNIGGSRWSKWEVAPGLELLLADGAADEVRELAEEIRQLVRQRRGGTYK
jgi:Ca-activated chloride channel family protein